MHRARRALTRRWALWTVALTLGAALGAVQEMGAAHATRPPASREIKP